MPHRCAAKRVIGGWLHYRVHIGALVIRWLSGPLDELHVYRWTSFLSFRRTIHCIREHGHTWASKAITCLSREEDREGRRNLGDIVGSSASVCDWARVLRPVVSDDVLGLGDAFVLSITARMLGSFLLPRWWTLAVVSMLSPLDCSTPCSPTNDFTMLAAGPVTDALGLAMGWSPLCRDSAAEQLMSPLC